MFNNQLKLALLVSAAALSVPAEDTLQYGAGEMTMPGRNWYVSTKGSNRNDGKTLETAWKTIPHAMKSLRAGDTLHIDEGEYPMTVSANINAGKRAKARPQCGKPGSPIRIMGIPGKRVVLNGAEYFPCTQPVQGKVFAFTVKKPPFNNAVYESPSQILLQKVPNQEIVLEYPGTYCHDEKTGKMLVHFAAENQQGIRVLQARSAFRIMGNYILLENLIFQNFAQAVFITGTVPRNIKAAAEHITIRNCQFMHNLANGIVVNNAAYSLFTGNRGMMNGSYGSFMMGTTSHDNMVTGNWFGPNPLTCRISRAYGGTNYTVNLYCGVEGLARNHFIGNVMENSMSFRWKPTVSPDSRIEDNLFYGSFYIYSKTAVPPLIIRGNWFRSRIIWLGKGENLWQKDFQVTPIVFENNVRDRKDFNPQNKIVFEAEKLKLNPPEIQFPEIVFDPVEVKYIGKDSAAVLWQTPENDGWGRVDYRVKGTQQEKHVESATQGVRHQIGLLNLKPDTEYEYKLSFKGRHGGKAQSKWMTFRTTAAAREPQILEVGPGKLSLSEAGLAAFPGDTIKVLPGRHVGPFIPIRDGRPGKPITLKGEPGAIIDGISFYAPLINLTQRKHFVIDGLTFANAEKTKRLGLISARNSNYITVKNCKAKYPFGSGQFFSGSGSNLRFENNISDGGDYPVILIGKNLTVTHNTILNATHWSVYILDGSNITITDNIFYRPCIPAKRNHALLLHNIRGPVTSDRNVFWSPYKTHPVGGTIRDKNAKILKASKDLADWQKLTGYDMNSIHADPQFVNIEAGDYRLQPDSPAAGKGAEQK